VDEVTHDRRIDVEQRSKLLLCQSSVHINRIHQVLSLVVQLPWPASTRKLGRGDTKALSRRRDPEANQACVDPRVLRAVRCKVEHIKKHVVDVGCWEIGEGLDVAPQHAAAEVLVSKRAGEA